MNVPHKVSALHSGYYHLRETILKFFFIEPLNYVFLIESYKLVNVFYEHFFEPFSKF